MTAPLNISHEFLELTFHCTKVRIAGTDMATSNRIAEVAAVSGEPARAAMLAALMDGRALTVTELVKVAAITQQTASGHLARLASVALITD